MGLRERDKETVASDYTAVRVALWRALHLQVDPPPHVFEDEVGSSEPPSYSLSASPKEYLTYSENAQQNTTRTPRITRIKAAMSVAGNLGSEHRCGPPSAYSVLSVWSVSGFPASIAQP